MIHDTCIRISLCASILNNFNNYLEFHKTLKKSGYNMYRGCTQIEYQNTHYNINQKDERTLEDRGRDGGTNFILRITEQETRLTLHEHEDDDDDDDITLRSFS